MAVFNVIKKRSKRRSLNGEDSWRIYGHGTASVDRGNDYHYARIPLGNPPQYMDFIIDTGSGYAYIPCEKVCETCGTHTHPYYEMEKSQDYAHISCKDEYCQNKRCNSNKNMCEFSISYGEGSSVKGTWFSDVVSFSKNENVRVYVGCIREETKLIYGQDADGVMGIEDIKYSITNQILANPIYENTLNLCLAHDGGFMEFGREHIPENIVYTKWVRGSCRANWYKVKTEFIEINGDKILPIGHQAYQSRRHCGTAIDSGNSDIQFPGGALWDGFKTILEKYLKFTNSYGTNHLCFSHTNFEEMKESVPIMTFHFEGGAKLVARYENIFEVNGDKICTTVYKGSDGILLGGAGIENNFISIDKDNGRIGFANMDCKKYAEEIGMVQADIDKISPGAEKSSYIKSSFDYKKVMPQKTAPSFNEKEKVQAIVNVTKESSATTTTAITATTRIPISKSNEIEKKEENLTPDSEIKKPANTYEKKYTKNIPTKAKSISISNDHENYASGTYFNWGVFFCAAVFVYWFVTRKIRRHYGTYQRVNSDWDASDFEVFNTELELLHRNDDVDTDFKDIENKNQEDVIFTIDEEDSQ